MTTQDKHTAHVTWFVDEAGDPTLFGKGGKVVAATDGCSRFFIAGKLECRDVQALTSDLDRLRSDLLSDPFFKDVPSLDPARKRTAVHFHAKDDPPEVRFLVYKLLAKHDLRFVAVVRDKLRLLDYAQQRRRIDPAYRYDPDGHELYDELTRHLFSRMHGLNHHKIVFAQRGHKPRTKAFVDAIEHDTIPEKSGLARPKPTEVLCSFPKDHAGLQAVDYYLWALQRFYERSEVRYLNFVWPQILEVLDLDLPQGASQFKQQSTVFNQEHPLTLESRAGVGKMDREI
ncbi:DUF3800 domain-containing protein [Limnohabitans sp. WS1]|uniref:DUF3800 domain-containing protein n=1 Tax=Limnohabitans sp. WS1 TaxID=1100726 RepID=UPI0011B23BBB|nr:DUF3800 domain-containing protein [Limnohabitans sp. WS1]